MAEFIGSGVVEQAADRIVATARNQGLQALDYSRDSHRVVLEICERDGTFWGRVAVRTDRNGRIIAYNSSRQRRIVATGVVVAIGALALIGALLIAVNASAIDCHEGGYDMACDWGRGMAQLAALGLAVIGAGLLMPLGWIWRRSRRNDICRLDDLLAQTGLGGIQDSGPASQS